MTTAKKKKNPVFKSLTPALRSKVNCVNRHADVEVVLEWAKSSPQKPAIVAFTEGPDRNIAYYIEELKAELAREVLQHQTAREEFAKEIAAVNNSFGDGDRSAFTKRSAEKDKLIDEFIVEMTKLLPSSDLLHRAREHRGAI